MPFAQQRNIVGGYLLSILLGLAAVGGSVLMVTAAILYHRASKRHEYPVYW